MGTVAPAGMAQQLDRLVRLAVLVATGVTLVLAVPEGQQELQVSVRQVFQVYLAPRDWVAMVAMEVQASITLLVQDQTAVLVVQQATAATVVTAVAAAVVSVQEEASVVLAVLSQVAQVMEVLAASEDLQPLHQVPWWPARVVRGGLLLPVTLAWVALAAPQLVHQQQQRSLEELAEPEASEA